MEIVPKEIKEYLTEEGQDGDKIIILLYGGDKKRQQKDIQNAIIYWHDYKRREDG
jgi:putative component of toxin-antitoxin plasmid stabilization module